MEQSKFEFEPEPKKKKKDNPWDISEDHTEKHHKPREVSVPEGHDGGPIQKRKYRKKHVVSEPPTVL